MESLLHLGPADQVEVEIPRIKGPFGEVGCNHAHWPLLCKHLVHGGQAQARTGIDPVKQQQQSARIKGRDGEGLDGERDLREPDGKEVDDVEVRIGSGYGHDNGSVGFRRGHTPQLG